MTKFLEKIFGASWRTSLWGWICAASATVAAQPSLLQELGLPENMTVVIGKIAIAIAAISGGTAFQMTKDKRVTGGDIPASREAAIRVANEKSNDLEITTIEKEVQKKIKEIE